VKGRRAAAAGAWVLAPVLSLVACPSLSDIRVASGDGAVDVVHAEARPRDARDVDVNVGAEAVLVSSNDLAPVWCALLKNGDVECWGNNDTGQLGNGNTTASPTPVKVLGLDGPATSVSVGLGTVCATTQSKKAYCWGLGQDGELGTGAEPSFASTAVLVEGLDNGVTAISAGERVVCAVKDGGLLCWGDGLTRLLGTSNTNVTPVPTPVSGLDSGVTGVSVGINVACAVADQSLYCWGGFDGFGELGNGTTTGSFTPTKVQGLGPVRSVSAGAGFVCAVEQSGAVKCWGDGSAGALGNGELAISSLPVQVHGLTSGWTAVSAGAVSACALDAAGAVSCWGYAADGELGDGPPDSSVEPTSLVPVPVPLPAAAVSIATGQAPCAVLASGQIECWGIVAEDALVPEPVATLAQITTLTTGGNLSTQQYACAISSGTQVVSCWGGNPFGQFGNGSLTGSNIPVQILALPGGMTSISAGPGVGSACGVAAGTAYCWGNNAFGQLGDGTQTSSAAAKAVSGLSTGVLSVAVGATFACALTSAPADAGGGGAVSCWGDNTAGQLGNGSATATLVPGPVQGLSGGVMAVALGPYSACALLADGTVRCWGSNTYGQLGDGTHTTRLMPTPVASLSGVTALSLGWWTTCALASGGVECWGDNTFGELGNDTTVPNSTTPVTVSGLASGATSISVGQTSACAVVAGGLQCWGLGPIGNALGPITSYTRPQAVIGPTSGVTEVSVAAWFACAIVRQDVRCWGFNTAGELGNNGAEDSFLPTAVPGFP
jgi:alpha-tubulin suppressor-like RCC1 family protein